MVQNNVSMVGRENRFFQYHNFGIVGGRGICGLQCGGIGEILVDEDPSNGEVILVVLATFKYLKFAEQIAGCFTTTARNFWHGLRLPSIFQSLRHKQNRSVGSKTAVKIWLVVVMTLSGIFLATFYVLQLVLHRSVCILLSCKTGVRCICNVSKRFSSPSFSYCYLSYRWHWRLVATASWVALALWTFTCLCIRRNVCNPPFLHPSRDDSTNPSLIALCWHVRMDVCLYNGKYGLG